MFWPRTEVIGVVIGWLNIITYAIASGFLFILTFIAYLPILKPILEERPELRDFIYSKKTIFHLGFLVFCFLKFASGIKLIIGTRTVSINY